MFAPIGQLNDEIKRISSEMGIRCVDTFFALADSDGDLDPDYDSGDGAHFNAQGYKRIGEFVAAEIPDLLGRARVVACLGDSLTEGFPDCMDAGWGDGKPYPDYLERAGLEILNFGICGDTTMGMGARFHGSIRDRDPKPDLCLIMGGTNDIFMDFSPSEIAGNLESIYRDCRRHGIEPVAMTVPPIGKIMF